MRGHCLLVPGDTGVILHPQRGEALEFLPTPINIAVALWSHFGLSVGEPLEFSLSVPPYTLPLPGLTCPPYPVRFSSRAFFHSPFCSSLTLPLPT